VQLQQQSGEQNVSCHSFKEKLALQALQQSSYLSQNGKLA
jgi:hypothetical protein